MKRVLFSFAIFSMSFNADAQNNSGRTFELNEIGWTFVLPEGFELTDSSTKNVVVSTNTNFWIKQLIFKHKATTLLTTVSTTGPKGDEAWEKAYKKEADHFYKTISSQNPSVSYDTTTTSAIINSIPFTKFTVVGMENGKIVYRHFKLRKLYKNYRFNITYNGTDELDKSAIENMLNNSSFTY